MATNNQTMNDPKPTRKPKDEPKKPRNVVFVRRRDKNESPDEATARVLTAPSLQAAATIQQWQGDDQEVNALAKELAKQITIVHSGDLGRAEGMLIAQAHTLDELFNHLARRARHNLGEYLIAGETYLRLAFKAQSQCRATLETLAQIKNPPSVAFVKQANIAHGPQQVNNEGASELPRTGENKIQQNKLSEVKHELLPDSRASALTGGINSPVGTLEKIDRAEND